MHGGKILACSTNSKSSVLTDTMGLNQGLPEIKAEGKESSGCSSADCKSSLITVRDFIETQRQILRGIWTKGIVTP